MSRMVKSYWLRQRFSSASTCAGLMSEECSGVSEAASTPKFGSTSTMLDLSRLARLDADHFRMPDALWVRIVYDFALGYRLRTINRDHLLRAITPLYLAWVASYALEMEAAAPSAAEQRLERLSVAYETGKPYLLSRWRWPDRFNP